jgi:hypothetical protein
MERGDEKGVPFRIDNGNEYPSCRSVRAPSSGNPPSACCRRSFGGTLGGVVECGRGAGSTRSDWGKWRGMRLRYFRVLPRPKSAPVIPTPSHPLISSTPRTPILPLHCKHASILPISLPPVRSSELHSASHIVAFPSPIRTPSGISEWVHFHSEPPTGSDRTNPFPNHLLPSGTPSHIPQCLSTHSQFKSLS